MDTNPSSETVTFASRTPLHIGAVGLVVRNLDAMLAFYRDVIGLAVQDRTPRGARLGVGGVTLVELEHRPEVRPDDPGTAGLYHTAFLHPTRRDLAQWVTHIARQRVPITGASDHAVSEAFYLDDPEGNGVEVYFDRPAAEWQWTGDGLRITTDPLDVDDLLRAGDPQATFAGAPAGLRIGHVHLRVGDITAAKAFYLGPVGLDLMMGRGGAAFMSSGRYHHHLAANVWHSRAAGPREGDRAGLAWFSFEANDAATRDAAATRLRESGARVTDVEHGIEAQDPWGTRMRILAA